MKYSFMYYAYTAMTYKISPVSGTGQISSTQKAAIDQVFSHLLPPFFYIGGGGDSNSRRHLSGYSRRTAHIPSL